MANFFEQFDQPQQPSAVDVTVKPYAAAVAPATPTQPNYFAQFEDQSAPNTALDALKSGASGVATGLVGAASLAPRVIGSTASGLMKLNELAGNPLQYISPGGTGLEQAAANQKVIAQAMGRPSYDYTPQTTTGQYLKTGGEFLGNTIGADPLGGLIKGTVPQIAKRVIGQVALPAVASEAAGQATQGTALEPYARAAAGLATGALGAGVTGGVPNPLTRATVKANATRIYQSPELKAAELAPQSIGDFANNVEQQLAAKNFSRVNIGSPFAAVDNLKKMASNGSATLANVRAVSEELGRTAAEVNARGAPTAEANAATYVKDQIRNYLDNLKQADLVKGDATKISPMLRAANQDWAAQATAFEVPKTLRKAQNFAKQNEIPIEEALALKAKNFTPQERAQAAQALSGGWPRKALQGVASLDPTKNPLALALHLGTGFLTGGASLPLTGVGTAAGVLNRLISQSQARNLRQSVLSRSHLASTLPPSTTLGFIPRTAIGGVRGGYGGILSQPYSPPP